MWGLCQTKTKDSAEKVKVRALYKTNLRYCFKKSAILFLKMAKASNVCPFNFFFKLDMIPLKPWPITLQEDLSLFDGVPLPRLPGP